MWHMSHMWKRDTAVAAQKSVARRLWSMEAAVPECRNTTFVDESEHVEVCVGGRKEVKVEVEVGVAG